MTMHGFTVEKLIGQMGIKDLRRKKGRGGGEKAITALSLAAKEFLYFGPMNNIGRK